MAATVSTDRRNSPGGSHPFSSVFAMDRDNQRRSRSSRHHQASSGNRLDSPKRSEEMENSSVISPGTPSRQRPAALNDGAEEGRGEMQDWRYPRSSTSSLKRRNSQRSPSPSRPRSQQGSQVDQARYIDDSNKMDSDRQDAPTSRKQARHSTKQTHRKSHSEDLMRNVIEEEEERSPREDMRNRDGDVDREASQPPHSRTYSVDTSSRPLRQAKTNQEEDSVANYTWQAAQERDVRSYREVDGAISRTPLLNASYKAMAAPLAPNTAITGAPSTSGQRPFSPSPRLPAFVNMSSQQHEQSSRPTSPRHLSSATAYNNLQYPSPRPGTRSMHANPMQSPTPSQSSQSQSTLPGQPFMPPSLTGSYGSGAQANLAASKQQPSFVSKLYSMLEDDSISEMICWGPSGTVFSVANPAEFSKVVLPNWFKHSNWQSFVRQLNMYGFHKVNHTYQGTPEDEVQVWEFKHPSFRRGEAHLLNDIKRKSSRHKRQGSYGRSMGGMTDYDLMAGGGGGRSPGSITPSPEMGMHYLTSSGAAMRDAAAMPGPSRPQQQHHQQSRHHTSHSMGGAQDYPGGYPASTSSSRNLDRGMPPSASSSIAYAMGPGEMATSRSGHSSHNPPGSHQYQQGHYPPGHQSHRRGQHGGSISMVQGGNDMSTARMDDLSDRIDAIIRHASYMENQLRSVSDQLFQSQQNEISMSRHINYLESQFRSMEEQLHVQSGSIAPHRRPAGSPSTIHPSMPPASSSRELTRSQTTLSNLPPPKSPVISQSGYPSSGYQRGATHSSADAYQKLPPPPPSVAGGSSSDGRGRKQ